MLLKSCPAKVKAAGPSSDLEEGQFTALVSVFGNVDSYGDRVVKGAFEKTLADWEASGNPIPVYYSHRMDDPDYNIGHVVEAKETDEGLWIKGQLDLDNEALKARQVYRLLKGGRLTQFSFAYDVEDYSIVKDEDTGREVYELRQLKLYEAGPTPIGANQETELLGVKAAAQVAQRLVDEVKAGRELSAKNIDMLAEVTTSLDASSKSIKELLARVAGEGNDQEKASGEAEAKSGASDEEPPGAKSSASDKELKQSPSVARLAAQAHIYALMGAEGGSR